VIVFIALTSKGLVAILSELYTVCITLLLACPGSKPGPLVTGAIQMSLLPLAGRCLFLPLVVSATSLLFLVCGFLVYAWYAS